MLAAQELRTRDPKLAVVIDAAGLPDFAPHSDYFLTLLESIIGQQLSVKAAATITGRFLNLFEPGAPTPGLVLTLGEETYRSVGLSRQKIRSITDLAGKVLDGSLDLSKLPELSDAEISAEVTKVIGIGPWTAHMFLLFCMGRPSVLPVGDLGIRIAIQKLYGLEKLPDATEIKAIAEQNRWAPHESIASWYLWRSLDIPVTS